MLEKTPESPFYSKQIKLVNFKGNQPWMFILKDYWWNWSSSTLNTCCEEPTHWKKTCYWERLRVGGEGGDRKWNHWMASLTQWTWVWTNFCRQWRTEKTGVLKSAESQRAGCNSMIEQTKIKPNGYVWIFVLKCRYTSNFTFWYSIAWMRLNFFFSIAEPLFH